jgi:tetratricopeptide (TPR) repeat protein
VQELETARSLEPFSPVFTVWLGLTYQWVGRREQALTETRRAWDLDSISLLVQNLGSLSFLQLGETDKARRIAREPISAAFMRGAFGYVRARTGDVEDARRIRQSIRDRGGNAWFDQINLAFLSLGIGDTASALDAMEQAADRGEPLGAFQPLSEPVFDPIRSSPRFSALLRRLGLDPAVIAAPRGGRTG